MKYVLPLISFFAAVSFAVIASASVTQTASAAQPISDYEFCMDWCMEEGNGFRTCNNYCKEKRVDI
jgi:hypothetical protein